MEQYEHKMREMNKKKENIWINNNKMINNKVSYNNETKYEFKWIIIRIIMIKIKINIIEKELTSSCKKKNKY